MQNLEIIEENSDYLVVNKTAGFISEKSKFEDDTVEDQVLHHLLQTKRKPFVGVIHRLDRVTSGVLIFAKKKSVLAEFNNQFRDRKVQKTYLAIVENRPRKDKETLTHFLVKNQLEKKADIVSTKVEGAQNAELTYHVMGRNEFGYLLKIKPKTGRFHQIRAQLAHIGLPIIGDEKYGSPETYLPLSVCLHAWKLAVQETSTGQYKTFEAPLPKNDFWDFKAV